MELSKCEQFTRKQLIEQATKNIASLRFCTTHSTYECVREKLELELRIAEIALATLTAPNDVPRPVLDGICDMSDAGVNAQGIWELCKAAVMGGVK
ncbi:hypothetical protein [Enterobacter mori]|uniref:hypothetical protein n=1 Tax=Enterobacter mori TaxID=539813 RepID=UPI002DBB3E75|nr:hypothetical protein [Enterobacter mori]MEB7917492.1 hypothetical protein [Enterobacter mori]